MKTNKKKENRIINIKEASWAFLLTLLVKISSHSFIFNLKPFFLTPTHFVFPTKVEQLHKIFKLCGSPSDNYWKKSKLPHTTIFKPQHQYRRCVAEAFKDFPHSALSLLDSLLAIEPESRGSATAALQSDVSHVTSSCSFNI
jgi:serine/threonine protein kinase